MKFFPNSLVASQSNEFNGSKHSLLVRRGPVPSDVNGECKLIYVHPALHSDESQMICILQKAPSGRAGAGSLAKALDGIHIM